jgi:hypothetical protein
MPGGSIRLRGTAAWGSRGKPGGRAKPGGSGGRLAVTGTKPGGIGGKPGGGGGRPEGSGIDSPLLLMNPGIGGWTNFFSLWFSLRIIGGPCMLILGMTELKGAIWTGCAAAFDSPSFFESASSEATSGGRLRGWAFVREQVTVVAADE